METKRKIGIVCDNYKVPKFLQELKDAGIDIISQAPFTKENTALTCFDFQSKVKPVIDKLIAYFDGIKSKNN